MSSHHQIHYAKAKHSGSRNDANAEPIHKKRLNAYRRPRAHCIINASLRMPLRRERNIAVRSIESPGRNSTVINHASSAGPALAVILAVSLPLVANFLSGAAALRLPLFGRASVAALLALLGLVSGP